MNSNSLDIKNWDSNTVKAFSVNDGKIEILGRLLPRGQVDELIEKVEKCFCGNNKFLIDFYGSISSCSKK